MEVEGSIKIATCMHMYSYILYCGTIVYGGLIQPHMSVCVCWSGCQLPFDVRDK